MPEYQVLIRGTLSARNLDSATAKIADARKRIGYAGVSVQETKLDGRSTEERKDA